MLRGSLAAGVGLSAAALVGCSGSGGGGTPAGTAGKATAPGGTAPVPQVSDGFINLATRDQPGLDPLEVAATVTERNSLVYGRLIDTARATAGTDSKDYFDLKRTPGYSIEGWEIQDGGKKIAFKMKKGVKYHNIAPVNGREQVASDVKWSIERAMTLPKSQFKAGYADIDKIETPDNYTVVFVLKRPSRYIMGALSQEPSFILPKEIDGMQGGFNANEIGSGPFIFEKLVQGEGSFHKKNPDFVNASQVYYNRFDVKVIPETQKRQAAVKTGQADDGAVGLDKTEVKLNEGSTVKFYQAPITGCNFFAFNLNNPKWKDVRVRTAISKAYNRQDIIDQTQNGDGSFNGPIPVGFGSKWALTDQELRALNANKYDPAEAKKLWDAAGKPFGDMSWYVVPKLQQPSYQPAAELMARQITQNLGIAKHNFTTDEYSVWLPKAYTGKYDDVTFGVWGNGAEPLNYLLWEYLPGGSRNFSNLNDPEVVKMIDDIVTTLDDTQAAQKAKTVSAHIADKVVASIKPTIGFTYNMYSAKLQDFRPGLLPYGNDFRFKSWKTK